MPEGLKMSVCSDFAEHVWKPGFCKICFYPKSSHRVQKPFEIAANNSVPSQSVKEVWNKTYTVQTEDDYVITSVSYSKPTIAVKPTMMSSDLSDTWTDVNDNATDVPQHNQKSPTEKHNMMQMLDLSKQYIDNNTTNKSLKDAIYQKATGDTLGCPKGYSSGALPLLDHKVEALGHPSMISNIFMSQEEGRGPQTFKENGTTPCKTLRQESNRSINSTYFNGDLRGNCSVETLDIRTLSSGSCDSHRETSSCCSTGHSWDQHAPLEIAINVVTTAAGHGEESSTSFQTRFSQEPGVQNPLESHECSDKRVLSLVSEAASLSDSCSCQSSSDCLSCSQELEYISQQRCETSEPCETYTKEIGRPQKLGPFLNQPLEQLSVQVPREPIYAESTKKKRPTNEIPRSPDQDQIPKLFHKKPDGFDNAVNLIDCSSGDSSQRAKITVMAAHTEEGNRTFYLSSPDSAVSTQWQHFSPNSTQELSFLWPQSNSQQPSEAGLTDKSGTLLHPRANTQPSPAIPPKQSRGSCSLKLGLPSLSEGGKEENEPSFQAEVHRSSFPFQSQNRNFGDMPVSATEKRHKYYNTCWSRECKIVEEEEGGEETAHQQSRVADIVNGAVVSELDLKLENAAAVSFSKEYNNPGTAYNSASHYHAGSASEQDKYNTNMLSKATSFTSEFAEETNDLAPPPPPPKKHHRESRKLSQSNFDLEKASHGSVESLTQSLRGLNTSLATASTDSLHSESRMFSDGSHEGALSPSPSHFGKNRLTSSPVSPQSDNSTISYGNSLLPPPLPQKKMVNRAMSAPDQSGGRSATHPRSSPRLNFSNSEGNVYGQDRSQFSSPSSPVDQRHLYSSNESLERCHPSLGQQLRSRTMEEVAGRNKSRLGLRNKSGASSSSSPQLSMPSSGSGSNLQLHTLLSNIDSREGVYAKLSSLYAESLRRLAQKCEGHFTHEQKNPLHFDESNWSLFKLTCNKPCCDAGDSVYYSASCAKDTKNTYAVKICKNQNTDSKQGHLYGLAVQQDLPPHFNLQQDCGHFIACVPQSMLPPDEAAGTASSSQQGEAASTGRDTALPNHNEQERVVVITRDVAYQTTADFVKEWDTFHRVQPEVYERRVCFLLLQLCNGLEHLKEHGVIHRDLCLENLLLVHNSKLSTSDIKDQRHLPRLVISNFAKAKKRAGTVAASDPKLKKDQARLAPEIVSASQYKKFDEFQTGILIYELLHQPNPFEVSPKLKEQEYYCEELPKIPDVSIYSAGLQQLACLLLEPDPIKRIHIQEAKRILQSLLWGPRKDLMEQQWDHQQGGPAEGLHNWLNLKRALLMMKFAERSLEPEQNIELEDWLCCQYFASANTISLCHTAELLHFCE
ncbi:inactive tyrosine-protein kinase PRAG1-like [Polyodon spathula]|uniref:inactive tyrosine-protein kinase PRAG1-like n=1 Tax=Polyodon spathula TaxID=7913 RepID=UPI001B7E8599|nr:inactive tyrosine-protein kinase PRAG1-like [Polyodon spathula]XP_041089784.1 inactive tyrosine-protein kinase PRAG1-like [Polyodon spathula]